MKMTTRRRFPLLLIFLTTLATASYSQPELDTTFNLTGKQTTALPGPGEGGKFMVVQPDNKIVVIGTSAQDFALVRYGVDGSLDGSFGVNGIVLTNFETGNGQDYAYAAALQSDGKIVVVGVVDLQVNQGSLGVARYNSDGSLDTSFGSGGKVVTNVQPGADQANAVVIQADERIVITGLAFVNAFSYQEVVVRYNSSGTLDSSFGNGGIVRSAWGGGQGGGDIPNSVTLQPDGKIVTVGTTRVTGSGTFWDAYVRRHNSDGTLDNSFDGDGVRTFVFSNDSDSFGSVRIQPDGKMLAGGSSATAGFTLVRLNSDGSSDTTFDGDGIAAPAMGGKINSIVLTGNGKITAAGISGGDFAVARYTPAGALDTTFSDDGKLLINFEASSFDEAFAGAYDSQGRVVLGGRSNSSFAAARLRTPLSASVSGRVTASGGRAVFNAVVYLDDGGTVRLAHTNPFGYYRFYGVPTGQAYTVSVVSKRFSFTPRVINVFDDLVDVDFVADP